MNSPRRAWNHPFAIRALVILCAACIALPLWLAACSARRGPPAIRNVLLISIDTCRPDRFGCYGDPGKLTPNIDALAARSVVFERVISSAPFTLPSHCTMLTGTWPVRHGVHDNLDYRLGEANDTLAEALKAQGMRTGAVVSAFVLDATFGMSQGFETYEDDVPGDARRMDASHGPERPAEESTNLALKWLKANADAPFFLFLHYFDPHVPYRPPEPYASRHPNDPYAGEIAYTDNQIGRVLRWVEKAGLMDSTLIVVTGDHGEAFGEHGEVNHGYFVYQSTLNVPLIVYTPGREEPLRVAETAALADIAPTILSLVGAPALEAAQGRDLSPYLSGESLDPDDRFAYFETILPTLAGAAPLSGVVVDHWKYIHTTRPELYDLANDPGEERNLAGEESDMEEKLRAMLSDVLLDQTSIGPDGQANLSQDELSRLQALGYVGGTGAQAHELLVLDTTRPDPKDTYETFARYKDGIGLWFAGEESRAIEICRETIEKLPRSLNPRRQLARFLMLQKKWAESVEAFEDCLRVVEENCGGKDTEAYRQQSVGISYDLGVALGKVGRHAEAIEHFEASLAGNSLFAEQYMNLGLAYAKTNQEEKAIEALSQALEMKDGLGAAHAALGSLLHGRKRFEEALPHIYAALKSDPNNRKAYELLGRTLGATGQVPQGLAFYEELVAQAPDAPLAHAYGGILNIQAGRLEGAARLLGRAMDIDSRMGVLLDRWARGMVEHAHADEAAVVYRELLRVVSDNPEYHYNGADAYARADNREEAIRHSRRALELRPGWQQAEQQLQALEERRQGGALQSP